VKSGKQQFVIMEKRLLELALEFIEENDLNRKWKWHLSDNDINDEEYYEMLEQIEEDAA